MMASETDIEQETLQETNTKEENQNNSTSSSKTSQLTEGIDQDLRKAYTAAKGWSSYLFSLGKSASETAAKTVSTTAKQFVEQVIEKEVVDVIPPPTKVFDEFNREQNKFIAEQKAKKGSGGHLPWDDCETKEESENLRSQVLDLSHEERHFTRNPPPTSNFEFDMKDYHAAAMALLKEDPQLNAMRFSLVPRKIKENAFWRNYFYRISLIKQSARLQSITPKSSRLENKEDSHHHSADKIVQEEQNNKKSVDLEVVANDNKPREINQETKSTTAAAADQWDDDELQKELQELEIDISHDLDQQQQNTKDDGDLEKELEELK